MLGLGRVPYRRDLPFPSAIELVYYGTYRAMREVRTAALILGVACKRRLLVGCIRSTGAARLRSIELAACWRSMLDARNRVDCMLVRRCFEGVTRQAQRSRS